MARTALALAVLTATLPAACGQADDDRGPATAPDLAQLVCGEGGARVLTPRAEARRDGLHLEVTNETAREVHLTLERSPSDAVGTAAPPGPSMHVLTIGPGAWTATCYGNGGSLRTGVLEVVETGIWVSTELADCETPESTHGDPPRRIRASEEELAEVARRALDAFVDLEPGYALERAGYPDQVATVFRARSGGRTVATMSFYPDGSGWWVEGDATTCGDPGPFEQEPGS
jgi:hypothetical protein